MLSTEDMILQAVIGLFICFALLRALDIRVNEQLHDSDRDFERDAE